jgi:hypothetical protein
MNNTQKLAASTAVTAFAAAATYFHTKNKRAKNRNNVRRYGEWLAITGTTV